MEGCVMYAGNENIHLMTRERRQTLRIELADFEGHSRYAKYDAFAVGSEGEKYKLYLLGVYSGNAGWHLRNLYSSELVNNDTTFAPGKRLLSAEYYVYQA